MQWWTHTWCLGSAREGRTNVGGVGGPEGRVHWGSNGPSWLALNIALSMMPKECPITTMSRCITSIRRTPFHATLHHETGR